MNRRQTLHILMIREEKTIKIINWISFIFREDIKVCKLYVHEDFCAEQEKLNHDLRMYNFPYFQTD